MAHYERCRCNLCHAGSTTVLIGPSSGLCRTSDKLQEWAQFFGIPERAREKVYTWSTEKGREKALSKLHRQSSAWTRHDAHMYVHAARAKGIQVPMMVYRYRDKVEFRVKRPHLRIISGGR